MSHDQVTKIKVELTEEEWNDLIDLLARGCDICDEWAVFEKTLTQVNEQR